MTEEVRSAGEILAAMQERYRELAGCDSDEASDIGIRLRILAKELAEIEARLLELREQAFPQTSTGVYLDRHAACRGLQRKGAVAGEGTLRFSRETATATDLPIPAGTVVATRFTPQLQFITSESGVLPAGEKSALLPAAAVNPGGGGNVSAGAVCILVSGLPGVTAVTNPAPFGGGLDEESDGALRERLLAAYRNISNGTNAAYYHDVAMQEPGVLSAGVIPRARGRGTVDVVVKCGAGFSADTAAASLAKAFAESREINVDAKVSPARAQLVAINVQLDCADGYESAAVLEECAQLLREYAAGLGVGEPLFVANLYKLLLETEGVRNARISAPAADLFPDAYTALGIGSLAILPMAVTS